MAQFKWIPYQIDEQRLERSGLKWKVVSVKLAEIDWKLSETNHGRVSKGLQEEQPAVVCFQFECECGYFAECVTA